MLTNVFKAQMRNPLHGDWIKIVIQDLEDFKIKETFDEIALIKEEVFKKQVAKVCRNYAYNKLFSKKKNTQKVKILSTKNLNCRII